MVGRHALAALALASGACNRDPLTDGAADAAVRDATVFEFDFSIADAMELPPVDLAAADLAGCSTYSRQPLPMLAMRLPDGAANLRLGAAIRIVAIGDDSSCASLVDAKVEVHPGNATDGVLVTDDAWVRPPRGGIDCDRLYETPRLIVLGQSDGLSSPMVIARDGAPKGTATLMFKVAPPLSMPDCSKAINIGGACRLDCECVNGDPTARCVPTAPGAGVCAISCDDDRDCPQALPHCRFTGPPDFVCVAERAKNCIQLYDDGLHFGAGEYRCPQGQGCVQDLCVPLEQPLSSPCHCAPDCEPDRLCAASSQCTIPCEALADCPAKATACVDGACQ